MKNKFLSYFAWISIAAAIITISLKTVAFFLTGSVGLLSDTCAGKMEYAKISSIS